VRRKAYCAAPRPNVLFGLGAAQVGAKKMLVQLCSSVLQFFHPKCAYGLNDAAECPLSGVRCWSGRFSRLIVVSTKWCVHCFSFVNKLNNNLAPLNGRY
jgi:hypothetical protein